MWLKKSLPINLNVIDVKEPEKLTSVIDVVQRFTDTNMGFQSVIVVPMQTQLWMP